MTRDCFRCGFTFPLEEFPEHQGGHLHVCRDCGQAQTLVWRVAGLAVDGIIRLRAIDALLYMGYVRAARLIACGLTDWPTVRDLRAPDPRPKMICAA